MNRRMLAVALALSWVAAMQVVSAQQVRRRAVTMSRIPTPLSQTDEDGQPDTLPTWPRGMSVAYLRAGDAVYHGKGGCVSCHGADATGVAGKGSSLTAGLNYIPKPYSWVGLDSLERHGIMESITRSNVKCPARGLRGTLTDAEVSRVAAYVWAIAQTRGEPWAGGHVRHQ